MRSRRDAKNNDDEGKQPAIAGKSVHAVGKKLEAMTVEESAKQREFLPDRSSGLSAVLMQVKNYAGNIYLGEAYRYCRMQADRLRQTANLGEDVLSVLCMTGSGRVVSQLLPSAPGVLLFVEEPTATSSGDGGTFVGLVINGFNEQLVGAEAKEKLEALSTQVSNTSMVRDMYQQEHMDGALAKQYALVCQQQCARLPRDFGVAAYAQPAVGSKKAAAVASSGESRTGTTKSTGINTKAATAGRAPTTRAATSPTNPVGQARAAPPSANESSALTWTHHLIPVTSQRVERLLRVYCLESRVG
jgi:hypothetical protein